MTGRFFRPHPTWPRRARMRFSFSATASSLSTYTGFRPKKRLKGFSTKKAVIRVSCLVFRENLGIRAGSRRATGYSRVSGFVFRKGLKISGLWLVNAWEALIRDSHGLRFDASLSCCLAGRGRKNKTEGLQYQQVPNEPRERP